MLFFGLQHFTRRSNNTFQALWNLQRSILLNISCRVCQWNNFFLNQYFMKMRIQRLAYLNHSTETSVFWDVFESLWAIYRCSFFLSVQDSSGDLLYLVIFWWWRSGHMSDNKEHYSERIDRSDYFCTNQEKNRTRVYQPDCCNYVLERPQMVDVLYDTYNK